MKMRVISNEENEPATKRNMKSKGKKPYYSPRLTVYGNLNRVTRGGGGSKKDPGAGFSIHPHPS